MEFETYEEYIKRLNEYFKKCYKKDIKKK